MNALVSNRSLRFSKMIDGYEPLDQSQINGITWSSLSYQTERARKRHIFLQSYKLETYDENSRRTKMKKIVVKMNSVMVSVLSFMWSHTLRTDCNCQSSIHVVPPTRIIRYR
uniref:Uncharacterized protein n=1 Tax=Solanum lycopersicum TaxID=4081 RepID=A0A3Q7HEY7_SOLLC